MTLRSLDAVSVNCHPKSRPVVRAMIRAGFSFHDNPYDLIQVVRHEATGFETTRKPKYAREDMLGLLLEGRKACDNLGVLFPEDPDLKGSRGYTYFGIMHIEDLGENAASGTPECTGRYCLIVERSEYRSDDLVALEWLLCQWAAGEGYVPSFQYEWDEQTLADVICEAMGRK